MIVDALIILRINVEQNVIILYEWIDFAMHQHNNQPSFLGKNG